MPEITTKDLLKEAIQIKIAAEAIINLNTINNIIIELMTD